MQCTGIAYESHYIVDEHPDKVMSITTLATSRQDPCNLVEADPLLLEALRVSRSTLGDECPATLTI